MQHIDCIAAQFEDGLHQFQCLSWVVTKETINPSSNLLLKTILQICFYCWSAASDLNYIAAAFIFEINATWFLLATFFSYTFSRGMCLLSSWFKTKKQQLQQIFFFHQASLQLPLENSACPSISAKRVKGTHLARVSVCACKTWGRLDELQRNNDDENTPMRAMRSTKTAIPAEEGEERNARMEEMRKYKSLKQRNGRSECLDLFLFPLLLTR